MMFSRRLGFRGRAQRVIPEVAQRIYDSIPERFVDDGCSNSPDGWFGFNFRWACRIHDWKYCSRCHPLVSMTQYYRKLADKELQRNISASLPWRWKWVSRIYKFEVRRHGGTSAWNSCGPRVGALCRHNMRWPL